MQYTSLLSFTIVLSYAALSGCGESAANKDLSLVEYQVPVAIDHDIAWQKLRDLSQAHNYVPGLTRTEMTTQQVEGVGASHKVHQGDDLVLDETVVEWREGDGFSLRLHRGDAGPVPPLSEAFFDYGLRRDGEQVILHNRMRYRVGLGFIGPLVDWLLVRGFSASSVRDVTLAQKIYYETGDPVTTEQLQAARAAYPE